MATINSSVKLAEIRSLIDVQQRIVSLLEGKLQESILGGLANTKVGTIFNDGTNKEDIDSIYGKTHRTLRNAMVAGLGPDGLNQLIDADNLRQMLYQARALLGEMRVEEQQWNAEVTEEKTRRKELGEFAKS